MANNERAKLRTLLGYWIEHGREHSQEFTEWANRARGIGEPETASELLRAAQEMEKAARSLSRALRSLDKGEP